MDIINSTVLLTKNETEEAGKIIGGNMFHAKPITGNKLLHCVTTVPLTSFVMPETAKRLSGIHASA